MPKTKISEFSATPANNTDIDSINIAENCPPSGINDAIRELMAQLKDFQTGAVGDSFNGPVGTTTAAAGAFTTLSSTGNTTLGDASGDSVTINGTATFANANPTLSAGTANGVAYLNGSKVVTSGSALTFDGTGLLGVGTNATPSHGIKGIVTANTANASGLQLTNNVGTGSVGGSLLYATSGDDFQIYTFTGAIGSETYVQRYNITSGGAAHIWKVGASEGMRLTSTGLGIGTSSPAVKLDVAGALRSIISGGTPIIYFNNGSTQHSISNSSGAMPFDIAGVERMRLDSSGNLGLGVTPSAWGTSGAVFKAIEYGRVGNAIAGISSGSSMDVMSNAYYNAGWKYANTGSTALRASLNGDTAGAFTWNIAPSGTAGNAITFSQAMTLDSSGNLLVGVTSGTSYRLALKTNSASQSAIGTSGTSGDTTYQAILVTKFDNDSTTSQNFIQFQINNGSANCGKITANGANTAAFGSTSDQRVKENIVELPSQLANIMALRPVEFDYIESYGGGHQIGFIAQEMQQVYPDVIAEDKSEEKILSITGWSKTEARLVKAIQEQQAIIESLKARLDAANL